ncbi:MAG: hypothetical protein DCC67_07950 [Planctomycetota bacterium]|nr:MAG: hypothetical protein DCC67_07950 [Planctomycetota bacterium]
MPASVIQRIPWRGRRLRVIGPALLAAVAAAAAPAAAITLEFDYRFDASGFFGTAEAPSAARRALELAARSFTAFGDELAAIQPGAADHWTAAVTNPSTAQPATVADLAVPHGTVIVFAGTRDLPSATLAEAGPGYYQNPSGSAAFLDAIVNRGQGASAADFGPWGGFIAFDTHQSSGAPRAWHFDVESPPIAGAYDFYTVAVHELAHLLGFGTSTAYWADVTGSQFDGAAARQLYQNPVPLSGQPPQHFDFGVTSPPFLGVQPQPSLGRTIPLGQRKLFTPLDYAAMADIGWSVPPELLELPGDVDEDHDVDGADFLAWQQGLGGAGGAPGDVNGDLAVDYYDGWLIRHYLGASGYDASPLAVASAAVPEPAGGGAWATALVMLTARRRWHARQGRAGSCRR